MPRRDEEDPFVRAQEFAQNVLHDIVQFPTALRDQARNVPRQLPSLSEVRDISLDILRQAEPPLTHTGISMAAFHLSLTATQGAGYLCRISCATPVMATVFGAAGVGFASLAAGGAGDAWGRWRSTGTLPVYLTQKPHLSTHGLLRHIERNQSSLLFDMVLGLGVFLALGGRLRSVMPSDVRYPGAYARKSIPAPGAAYATEAQKVRLKKLFKRYGACVVGFLVFAGCHHCGTKKGNVIGDHMPPNKWVHGGERSAARRPVSLLEYEGDV